MSQKTFSKFQRVGKVPDSEYRPCKSVTETAKEEKTKRLGSGGNLSQEFVTKPKKKRERTLGDVAICDHGKWFKIHNSKKHKDIHVKKKLNPEEKKQNIAMVKEKAQALLNKDELLSLKFYLSEYRHGSIEIRDFVRVLRKIFDCQRKETLFTEIREIVLEKDLQEFDRIIYEKGKLYERVIQTNLKISQVDQHRSLQSKSSDSEKKILRNKSMDKLRRLQYSLSSDNIRLPPSQLGGSQPILNSVTNWPSITASNGYIYEQEKQAPNKLKRKDWNHLRNKNENLKGSQYSLNEVLSTKSSNSYKNSNASKKVALAHFKRSSQSCEILLGSQPSPFPLSPYRRDNKDIEEEEKFLREEMKTEWIPKPTRSISLAMFQNPTVMSSSRCFLRSGIFSAEERIRIQP